MTRVLDGRVYVNCILKYASPKSYILICDYLKYLFLLGIRYKMSWFYPDHPNCCESFFSSDFEINHTFQVTEFGTDWLFR